MAKTLFLSAPLVFVLASGCIDATQKPCVEPGGAAASTSPGAATPAAAVATGPVKGCANPAANPDGLVDDFEDGNSQAAVIDNRDGYWWTHHDPNGSTINPEKFAPEDGGFNGSGKALHVQGKTSSAQGAYGSSIGLNLSNNGLYDASKYAGISFKAKVGAAGTKNVRFKIGDVNTHGQLGQCKSCWNHFGKDLELSTEWKEYRVMFAEAEQGKGWGDPRPKNVTPSQLASIDFTVGPGLNFDLWVDDVQLLTCP
ncbi:MAG: carbohydrate binding domain-containing protein [Polyangiaceae bacterium]